MNKYLDQLISIRRPYFNHQEKNKARKELLEYAKSFGYLCLIDAIVEAVDILFPGEIKKRPQNEYGIQLKLDLPIRTKDNKNAPRSGKSRRKF